MLKLYLKSSASLSSNLEKLLVVLDQEAHVVSHKEFIEKMYTTVNTSESCKVLQPFFEYCTSYAANVVADEYKKAKEKINNVVDSTEYYKVHGAVVYNVSKSLSHCTCSFFATMQLPCRHLLYVSLQQNRPLFNTDIIPERWTKQHNTDVNDNVMDLRGDESSTVIDVLKFSEVSPCKKR